MTRCASSSHQIAFLPPRVATAIFIAAHARSASGCSDVAAPSRCLEYRSITVARYSFGPRPSGPWDLGDITDPLGVGPLRGLVTLEQVGELQGGLVLPGQAVPAPDPPRYQALTTHRVRDRLLRDRPPVITEIGM